MEETFVWTSSPIVIPHNCTSASNLPWYGNWPLVNISHHAAAFGISNLSNPSFKNPFLLSGQKHNHWVQTAVLGLRCTYKNPRTMKDVFCLAFHSSAEKNNLIRHGSPSLRLSVRLDWYQGSLPPVSLDRKESGAVWW